MLKFNRNYLLEAQQKDRTVLPIYFPLTMEFTVTQSAWSSIRTCQIRVHNLNKEHREKLYRDRLDFTLPFPTLKLSAGYGPAPWPVIFDGCVQQNYSFKDSGSTDFITEWMGWDGVYPASTSFSRTPVTGPATQQQVVNQLANDLVNSPGSNLSFGYISNFDHNSPRTIYPRGRILFGNSWRLLQQETGHSAFIENSQLHVIQNSDYRGGGIPNINADTGLLAPPRRTESFLEVDILFEPGLYCGQLINLNSQSLGQFNGTHQILGISHKGIISGAVNGKCVTTLRLFFQIGNAKEIATAGLPKFVPA